jgi:hypothetical protein
MGTRVLVGIVLGALACGAWLLWAPTSPPAAPPALDPHAREAAPGTPAPPGLVAHRPRVDTPPPAAGPEGEPWSVEVLVVDEDGAPLAGIPVRLTWSEPTLSARDPTTAEARTWLATPQRRALAPFRPPMPPAVRAAGTSAADGLVRLATRGEGRFEVRADPPAPRLGTCRTLEVGATRPARRVTLRVVEGVALRGRVVDDAGDGVPAVLDLVTTAPWAQEVTWRGARLDTDGQGAFATRVPAGLLEVTTYSHGGLRMPHGPFAVPRAQPLLLRVPQPAGTLRVHVRDEGGTALAAAVVAAVVGAEATAVTMGESDAGGVARLLVPAGPVQALTVERAPWLTSTGTNPGAPWSGLVVPAQGAVDLDVTLRAAGSVSGVVRAGEDGPGLGGATVQLFLETTVAEQERFARREVVTDASGRYRLDGVALGRHVITARHPTHVHALLEDASDDAPAPDAARVVIAAGGAHLVRDIVLVAGGGIEGIVVDEGGRPVAGAEIQVREEDLPVASKLYGWGVREGLGYPRGPQSDAQGQFRLAVPLGRTVQIGARSETAVSPLSAPLTATGDAPLPAVRLVLQPGATLRGRAVRGDGGDPVEGAQVHVIPQADATWPAWPVALTTGAGGTFEAEGLPPRAVTLLGVTRAGGNAVLSLDAPAPGGTREDIELVFAPGHDVEVRVRHADDGTPVARLALRLEIEEGRGVSARTDADGRARFVDAPAGAAHLSAWEDGTPTRLAASVEVPSAGVVDVRYRPAPEHVIAGSVVDADGRPIPFCSVELVRGAARWVTMEPGKVPGTPVPGGVFRLVARTPPPYLLRVHAPCAADGRPLALRAAEVTVGPQDLEAGPIVIRLEPAASARLRVVDEDGAPVAGARVQRALEARPLALDAQGCLTLTGLRIGEVVTVRVLARGHLVEADGYRVTAGDAENVIRLVRGGRLAGHVVRAAGGPAPERTYVAARFVREGGAGGASAVTDAAGAFDLRGLPAMGTVDLVVRPRGAPGVLHAPLALPGIAVGTDDLVVRLPTTAPTTGRVLGSDGEVLAGAEIDVRPLDGEAADAGVVGWADDGGAFRVEGLAEGRWRLRARPLGSSGAWSAPVEVDAGSADVTLRLQPSTSIRGRVLGVPEGTTAWFVLAYEAGGDERGPRAPVEADGAFHLQEVPAGRTWDLWVRRGGGDLYGHRPGVPSGAGDVGITLMHGAAIEGRVEGLADGEASRTFVHVVAASGPGAMARVETDGRFRAPGLPPGRYRLHARGTTGETGPVVEGIEAGTSGVVLARWP